MDQPSSSNKPALRQPSDMERPVPGGSEGVFGSDVVANTLRALDIPYAALVPGSSFRGLHDSVINHLGNEKPQMLVCLHEDASVAIAHGYAKVTGKAMAAVLHANVGLMHAVMSVYNAWCDRMPILLLGATGPLDSVERRPWIDWIHTSRDQGSLIRGFVKWDDQPHSPLAAREAVIRAKWIADAVPQGPTYVNLDVGMQETLFPDELPAPDIARLAPPIDSAASPGALSQAVQLLKAAKRPMILVGRVSRSEKGWDERVSVAEKLDAAVISDLKIGAGFPTDHALHVAPPASRLVPQAREALAQADVILSLDWVDLAGTLSAALKGAAPRARIIQVSRDHTIHTGAHMDHQAHPPADLFISADPDAFVSQLDEALELPRGDYPAPSRAEEAPEPMSATGQRSVGNLAASLKRAVGERVITFTNLTFGWKGSFWDFRHPLDFVGGNGGGGVGGGPGIAVGVALALKESGRMPVCVCGDGDFLMGHTALWTAVHYGLPLLVVVANNTCYFNDVKHQELMATTRGREMGNKWIGQMITDPDLDIAALGRAQGASGYGPVGPGDDLVAVLEQAIADVEAGGVAVVDVRIDPESAR